jgi:hypothetical protein
LVEIPPRGHVEILDGIRWRRDGGRGAEQNWTLRMFAGSPLGCTAKPGDVEIVDYH